MGCPALHIDSRFSAYTPKLEVVRDFEYLSKLDVAHKKTTPKKVFKYYPYGMLMPERFGEVQNASYRFGYQGSEKDDEVKGKGNSYTTYYRQLDPRLGRWTSLDPKSTAMEAPFSSMGNNPISYNDALGDKRIYRGKTRKDRRMIRQEVRLSMRQGRRSGVMPAWARNYRRQNVFVRLISKTERNTNLIFDATMNQITIGGVTGNTGNSAYTAPVADDVSSLNPDGSKIGGKRGHNNVVTVAWNSNQNFNIVIPFDGNASTVNGGVLLPRQVMQLFKTT